MMNNTLNWLYEWMKTEYKFFFNIMVNDVACYDIVHSVSIMTLVIFCKKLSVSKLSGIMRKCVVEDFRPGMTQTGLLSYSD